MDTNYGMLLLDQLGDFLPEAILTVTILLVLVVDLLARGRGRASTWVSLAGLGLALVYTLGQCRGEQVLIFANSIAVDPIAGFFKVVFATATVLVILLSWRHKRYRGEYNALLITATLGMFLLAGARDFLILIVGLEILSIISYALAGLNREDRKSSEAALKYLLFGAMSSGFMLFGVSLLYGLTGSTNIVVISKILASQQVYPLTLMLAGLLVLAGIGYKIAMVPFHFWSPDVYEGSLTTITTFFSVTPKIAGLVALARILFGDLNNEILHVIIPVGKVNLPLVIAVLSAFTMTLGNLAAINQKNVKRLLAYSSIAHAGYLLMGIVVLNVIGLKAIMFYAVVYLLMNYGAFFIVDALEAKTGDATLKSFRGLGSLAPFTAACMTIFLMSLVGLPPLGGFIGKVYLFLAVIREQYYWLAVEAIVNSVISLYYYFSIARVMYFEAPENGELKLSGLHVGLITAMMVPVVILGVFWQPLAQWIEFSITKMF